MNTKNIVTLVAVLVVLVGGAWYFSSRSMTSDDGIKRTPETFASLLAAGRDADCTFENTDAVGKMTGFLQMGNGGQNVRADFVLERPDGKITDTHIIRTDGWNYMWGNTLQDGSKVQVTAGNRERLFDTGQITARVALASDAAVFSCASLRPDDLRFVVPDLFTESEEETESVEDTEEKDTVEQ